MAGSSRRKRSKPLKVTLRRDDPGNPASSIRGVVSREDLLAFFPVHTGQPECSDEAPDNFISCDRCAIMKYRSREVTVRLRQR